MLSIIKRKKVGEAGLQANTFLHYYSKLSKKCSAFCTANQSTNINLKKLSGFSD